MKLQTERLNDPSIFLAIEDLEIAARGIVEGSMLGVHRSPFTGFSCEFESHREYHLGDDLRHVNWKLWARTDQMFIKQYRSDTNLQLYLALDASGSMGTGNGPSRKWNWSARVAAALAHLAISCRDAAGLVLLRNGVFEHIPAQVANGQFPRILSALQATSSQGLADTSLGLDQTIHLCARRGMVVYFGDLFDNENNAIRSLATLRYRGHEVVVFHMLDPWEIELPNEQELEFSDLETSEKIKVSTASISSAYADIVRQWQEGIRQRCEGEGIDYFLCRTDRPMIDALLDFLGTRLGR
jgi:uncharacterized protein (DUF58 family)